MSAIDEREARQPYSARIFQVGIRPSH